MLFGICGLIISKMAADGHIGMMALSRVTFASAGLSCLPWECAGETGYGGTERTTGLMVGYEIMKVSRLMSGEDLVG